MRVVPHIFVSNYPQSDSFFTMEMDKAGYLIADETARTNLPGVFEADDARTKQFRHVIAAPDGALAAWSAEQYLAQ